MRLFPFPRSSGDQLEDGGLHLMGGAGGTVLDYGGRRVFVAVTGPATAGASDCC